MKRFEEIPHTADWSFRAFGKDIPELFENAAFAMFALQGGLKCVSDGAAAAIICRADLAKNFRDDYVVVKGIGLSVGARQGWLLQDVDMTHMEPTVQAGKPTFYHHVAMNSHAPDPAKSYLRLLLPLWGEGHIAMLMGAVVFAD